jgi:hypothetical protein
MGILDKIFGGGTDPVKAATPYLNQIPGVGHDAYDSYINAGKDASGKTKSQYENMINDPTGFINKLMEGYKPSEGYQFQKGELTKELQNNANAGGIAGTNFSNEQIGKGVQGLLSNDMQQFLTNVLGRYDTGLQGEQGIANQGFTASGNLADILGGNLNQQANMAFQGAQQKNTNKNGMFSALAKALGIGAGALTGGLPGAAAGGKIAGSIFGG